MVREAAGTRGEVELHRAAPYPARCSARRSRHSLQPPAWLSREVSVAKPVWVMVSYVPPSRSSNVMVTTVSTPGRSSASSQAWVKTGRSGGTISR